LGLAKVRIEAFAGLLLDFWDARQDLQASPACALICL
jgi:hypothetical protein